MTDATKKLFDAPWEIRPCNVGYDVVSAYNSIAEDRIFVAHADSKSTANRIARLPELYDALAEATRDYCSDCVEREIRYKNIPSDYDVVISGCPSCKDGDKCPPLTWLELLRKVRNGE